MLTGAQAFDEWLATAQPPEPPPAPTTGGGDRPGGSGGSVPVIPGGSVPGQGLEPPESPDPFEPQSGETGEEARERVLREQYERRLSDAVLNGRLYRQAQRLLDAEEHANAWKRPQEFGTLADELAMPEEPVTYRVERVLPTGANVALIAQYKTGKTTLVNHLVKCLVDGDPFIGRYPVDRLDGRVGIFNYEVGAPQYRRWLRDVGVSHVSQVALLHLRGLRLPLAVRDVELYVIDWLKRYEVQFWILDPYARALIGSAEENDNSGVGTFLDTLDVIKTESGVQELLMPVHTGRAEQTPGEERGRGATRIDDWPDVRWLLTKDETDRRYLKCTGRDVDEPEQGLAYDVLARSLSTAGAGRTASRRLTLAVELLRFITLNPGLGLNELYAAFPNRRADVVGALEELAQSRQVRIEPGPNRRKLHFPMVASLDASSADKLPPWDAPDPQAGLF